MRFASSFRDLQGGWSARLREATRRTALAALRLRRRAAEPGVRIVHYHYVFDDQRDSFERHLELLAGRLEAVSLSEAVRRLLAGTVRGREVVVTFDDGFRNQLTNAAPALRAYGFSACFYILTALVSAPPAKADAICRDRILMPLPVEPLTWDEVRELLSMGNEVGSHTRTHPDLTSLDEAGLLDELAGSRAELENRLGTPVTHFSAPFGDRRRFGPAVSEAARRAGYATCATAQRGINREAEDVAGLFRHHLVADWPLTDVRYFLGI